MSLNNHLQFLVDQIVTELQLVANRVYELCRTQHAVVRASARAATVQYSAVLRCGTVQYSTVLNSVPIPADPANNYALPAIVYADYLSHMQITCYLFSVICWLLPIFLIPRYLSQIRLAMSRHQYSQHPLS